MVIKCTIIRQRATLEQSCSVVDNTNATLVKSFLLHAHSYLTAITPSDVNKFCTSFSAAIQSFHKQHRPTCEFPSTNYLLTRFLENIWRRRQNCEKYAGRLKMRDTKCGTGTILQGWKMRDTDMREIQNIESRKYRNMLWTFKDR